MTRPWTAVCLQTPMGSVKAAASPQEAAAIREDLLVQHAQRLDAALAEGPFDLALFSEHTFGGSEDDLRGVMDFDGPEVEGLRDMARTRRIFLGATGYMRDPRFPGGYFNTSFLIDRSGEVVLKYLRLFTYHSVSPHDFWTEFVATVGADAAFPVAQTELGAIAMLSSIELMFPEVARAFALRGAEVLLHPTCEALVDLSVKRTRAAENMVAVVSANGPMKGHAEDIDVGSAIVDFQGHVLARCDQGVTTDCRASIDIAAERAARSGDGNPLPLNYLARLRAELCLPTYADLAVYPQDTYRPGHVLTTALTPENRPGQLEAALGRLASRGVIPAPSSTES